jgi:hypothetical protein
MTAGTEARSVALRSLQGIVDAAQAIGADAGSAANQAIAAVSDSVLSAGQTMSALAEQLVDAARARLALTPPATPAKPAARKRPARSRRRAKR